MTEFEQNNIEPEKYSEKYSEWLNQCESIQIKEREEGGVWVEMNIDPSIEGQEEYFMANKMPFTVKMALTGDEFSFGHMTTIFEDLGKKEGPVFNIDKVDWKKIPMRFMRDEVKRKLQGADRCFFWHGWASLPDCWSEEFVNAAIGSDKIAVLAVGMGNEGGCRLPEGKDEFTPEMYGLQMASFIKEFFGTENKINLYGHSMGGIGALWAAYEMLTKEEYSKANGNKPDLRLFLFAPAYDANANVFADLKMKTALRALILAKKLKIPKVLINQVGLPIAISLNKKLLPVNSKLSEEDVQRLKNLWNIHSGVALNEPETVWLTMIGLLAQESIKNMWNKVVANYPVVIVMNEKDRIVNMKKSMAAFEKLGLEDVLVLHEKLDRGITGTHYSQMMSGANIEAERTIVASKKMEIKEQAKRGEERRKWGPLTWIAKAYERAPENKLSEFITVLQKVVEETARLDSGKRFIPDEPGYVKRVEQLMDFGLSENFAQGLLKQLYVLHPDVKAVEK